MIKLTIDRNHINQVVERGIKLHGHAGPYLNLGIRMGLLALELLDVKGYFDLVTEVDLRYHTPISCLIDGLQISTGCTMGKGNIKVNDQSEGIRAFFRAGEKSLWISLKPEITELIDFHKESCEDLGQQILNMNNRELFDYEEKYDTIQSH